MESEFHNPVMPVLCSQLSGFCMLMSFFPLVQKKKMNALKEFWIIILFL